MITTGDETEGLGPPASFAIDAEIAGLLVQTRIALASGDPLRALHALNQRAVLLEDLTAEVVALARAQGLTWQAIGDALGVTRQAVWQRYEMRGSQATWRPLPLG